MNLGTVMPAFTAENLNPGAIADEAVGPRTEENVRQWRIVYALGTEVQFLVDEVSKRDRRIAVLEACVEQATLALNGGRHPAGRGGTGRDHL